MESLYFLRSQNHSETCVAAGQQHVYLDATATVRCILVTDHNAECMRCIPSSRQDKLQERSADHSNIHHTKNIVLVLFLPSLSGTNSAPALV